MKRNQIVLLAALIIFSVMIGACTRSASGGASDAPEADTLPNPVSTQSQLMKDIIAGTQTAMAVPLDATLAAGTKVADTDNDDDTTVDATAEPDEVEPTPKPLPTSTAGPAPVVALDYNTKKCSPGLFICTTEVLKDQSIKVQVPAWLQENMEITFKMGPNDLYDYSKYVVVGTATYKPDGSKGYGFQTSLNIPDSLRGVGIIVVRLETDNPGYWGSDYFDNK